MSNDINLLISRPEKDLARLNRKLRILRLVAMVFLFLIAGASIVLFIFIAASPLPALKRQENTALTNITTLHTRMGKLLLLQNQMKDVTLITTNRTKFEKTYDELVSVLPEGTTLNTIQMSRQSIALSLGSSNLSAIETYLQSLKDLSEKKKLFSHVYLNGFALDKKLNRYLFYVQIQTGVQ